MESIQEEINLARSDIERHFDLMQIKHGLATPELVKQSYLSPLCGQQVKTERNINHLLSESLDILVAKYLNYCEREARVHARPKTPSR